MIPTWRDVNAAIRDLDAPGPRTAELVYAAEKALSFPLSEWEIFDLTIDRNRRHPLTGTDAAIAWVERLVPGTRLQFWNQAAGGGWCATVTCREEGVEAQALALSLPFALLKAAVEAKVDLDLFSQPGLT